VSRLRVPPLAAWALFAVFLGMLALSPTFSFAQDQSDSQRKIVNRVVPSYPELARQMDIKGTVRVVVVVSPAGKVKTAQLIGGHPVLAKAAMDAIDKWKWAPVSQETKELIELNFHP
jgi:TonB family C-terminal domain